MDNRTRNNPARYFAHTIRSIGTGRVNSSSSVPVRISSENRRMHKAGTKKRYSTGASEKNGCKSAIPLSGILYAPGTTHKNNPLATKKKSNIT